MLPRRVGLRPSTSLPAAGTFVVSFRYGSCHMRATPHGPRRDRFKMKTPQLFDLSGKTALVTGGGRGLGRHIALGLAEAGADVFLASRKEGPCRATAEEISAATGRRVVAIPCDLAADGAVDELADRVFEHIADRATEEGVRGSHAPQSDGLDILVNNAAMVWAAPTLEYPIEGWDRVMNLNLRALWLLSQRVARDMAERDGGSIIHISSISAFSGSREDEQPVIAYNASKGALITLTKDIAVKLAEHGIRVNAIAPGPFLTDMMNYVRDDAPALARFESVIPMRRSGTEDDIKGAATFLASDASRFVTGHTLVVDGGTSAVDAWPPLGTES